MKKIFLVSALVFGTFASAQATDVTWDDKVANDNTAPLEATEQFSAADANAVKTAVNSKANLSRITWVTSTAYTANNTMVAHGGHVFVCISNHTSGASTEPGTGADWDTVWKYHGSDLYAAALGADDNYVTAAEKTRIGNLEATDDVSFGSVTATGVGGLKAGVAGSQQGALTLYTNTDPIYTFGFTPAATPSAIVAIKAPPAMPGGSNYLWNVDADGTSGWTDPATLGGDDLGSAAYTDVVALWTTCSAGYLKYDGTCSTPSGSMVYPGSGIPNSTGSAWGTSYTLDTDLSTTSASDDTLPSAKSVKALVDGLPTLTIQTSSITTGATNILGSDYGLIADTDGDGLPNKVDLAAAGTVQTDANGVVSSVAAASSAEINTGTDTTKPVTADALSGSNLGIEPVGWMIKNSATATAVADGTEAFVVPASMDGRNLVDVTAATASPNGGTGGSTTVVIRRVRTTAAMGDATSQYDLTFSTPNVTITWDGTGTDPGIANTAASLQAGDEVDITGFATAANNGHWTIATVGANYITFANAAGVENLNDIGVTITPTKHRDMTSTGATVAYTEYSANDETVDTGYDDIATGDRIYVDVTGITTTAGAKGLSVTSSFQLP